ncbi:Heparan-alpha-glucosaminide N-acetyltransferase [Sesamum angolense]|uniref:Heparan-alpha-glucosaminide N-acetyltransferase n=1 Tax=Sesamum angolense TaxID=2727404 RepID=A0AAE1WLT7_9LAMI|nr:Heparan-alpha-glucosaminide N-acetyltransferase [Sesamum angolense]
MASYQLIKEAGEDGTLDLQRKDCTLHVEGCNGDVESALQKIYPSSPLSRSGSDTGANGATSPSGRLVSLDVFRGLTVVLMILVDDAGGILPAINHSPWNGLTLADVVMPFFLFMVGVSLALVYKNMSSRAAASKKAIFRALKLLIFGVFLQGGYFHGINNLTYGVDMDLIRWMGILQRIAVAYLVAAMCEIWLRNDEKVNSGLSLLKKYKWHWIMMLMLTTIYMLLLYGLFVPDWEYQIPIGAPSEEAKIFTVKCGVHGDTGPACNAAGMIDRMILGVKHLYRRPIYARTKQCSINSPDYGPLPTNAPSWCQAPFDPEGILSTVMAIVTCLIGLQFGHIIVHFKDHRNRLLLWLAPSSAFVVLGVLCDIFGMHINKALYSVSYTCVTSGLAGLLLATIYLVVDVYGCRRFALVLEWMGMHALLIYILVACNILPLILQGFYWRDPSNNILSLVGIRKQT